MSDVPMPKDLSEEAVAEWMDDRDDHGDRSVRSYIPLARAVRALVSAKVRECIAVTESRCSMPRFAPKGKAYGSLHPGATDDEIVARVMGKEAPK